MKLVGSSSNKRSVCTNNAVASLHLLLHPPDKDVYRPSTMVFLKPSPRKILRAWSSEAVLWIYPSATSLQPPSTVAMMHTYHFQSIFHLAQHLRRLSHSIYRNLVNPCSTVRLTGTMGTYLCNFSARFASASSSSPRAVQPREPDRRAARSRFAWSSCSAFSTSRALTMLWVSAGSSLASALLSAAGQPMMHKRHIMRQQRRTNRPTCFQPGGFSSLNITVQDALQYCGILGEMIRHVVYLADQVHPKRGRHAWYDAIRKSLQ